jgi:hypothetical protein
LPVQLPIKFVMALNHRQGARCGGRNHYPYWNIAKSGANTTTNWEMVTFAFSFLIIFWLAIWILEFWYYNRLLAGAADALFKMEEESKCKVRIRHIEMSTNIHAAILGTRSIRRAEWKVVFGRWVFLR